MKLFIIMKLQHGKGDFLWQEQDMQVQFRVS